MKYGDTCVMLQGSNIPIVLPLSRFHVIHPLQKEQSYFYGTGIIQMSFSVQLFFILFSPKLSYLH